ncbi:MAG: hypothetical protein LBD29_07635 [Treponema sp.]|jgi:hypothetical protein|nr:hypothetical protein [Treponema sp.]
MKRYIILGLWSALVVGGAVAQSLQGAAMYVAVKSVQLKASTALFAANQGSLEYGNPVAVLQEQGKWVEVRSNQPAVSGWMASAGLTSKRIIPGGGASASANELALAGKGFSEAVEQGYQQDDNVDYTLVDRLEAHNVSSQTLYDFLTEGHLITEE